MPKIVSYILYIWTSHQLVEMIASLPASPKKGHYYHL